MNILKTFIVTLFLACVMTSSYAKDKFTTHVTVTTYNAVKSQTDNSPLEVACGEKIDLKKLKSGKLKWIAVSRDLLWCIPLHSIVMIEGYGCYEVKDTMNARYNHCIDILQHSSQKNFKKEKVKITLVKKPEKKR